MLYFLPLLPLQNQAIRNHSDKFAIGGFALGIGHGVAEILLQGFQGFALTGCYVLWNRSQLFIGVTCVSL